jgi:hypothetical protein
MQIHKMHSCCYAILLHSILLTRSVRDVKRIFLFLLTIFRTSTTWCTMSHNTIGSIMAWQHTIKWHMTQLDLSTVITITTVTISSSNLDSKKCPLLAMIIPYHYVHFNGMANIALPLHAKNKNCVHWNRWCTLLFFQIYNLV